MLFPKVRARPKAWQLQGSVTFEQVHTYCSKQELQRCIFRHKSLLMANDMFKEEAQTGFGSVTFYYLIVYSKDSFLAD